MLEYFTFDETVENVTEYLTRMAGVLDSIQNDVEYEGINYNFMLTREEQNAIKVYVSDFIIKDVINTAEGIAAEKHLGALTNDFVTETVVEVLTNFYKFNNPRFKKAEENQEKTLNKLSVFVKIYSRPALRKVFESQQHYGTRDNRKIRNIDRTINYILTETSFTSADITAELIEEYMPEVTSQPINADEINRMFLVKQSLFSIDAYDKGEELVDERDYFTIADPAIEKFLKDWIDGMRTYKKLIFLQGYQFCPDEYKDMSVKEFSCDECLLKACRMDNIGRKSIKHGDVKIVRTANNVRAEDASLKDVDYVAERCIIKMRHTIMESLKKYIKESGIPKDELECQVERFFCKYCDELIAELKAMQ